jgi:hypothetical protein
MSRESTDAPPVDPDLTVTYILVLIVEVVVLVGLYWLGRYFS